MPATVVINELNTAGATKTDKTGGNVRFKRADNATVDLIDPLVVPAAAGRTHSFAKVMRTEITGGVFTQLTNLRAYSDGANNFGTGVNAFYSTSAAFNTPAIPDEADVTPEFPGTTVMTDFFTATQASPITLGAGPFTVPGDIGDHLNMCMQLLDTASQGLTPGEPLTVAFDEI